MITITVNRDKASNAKDIIEYLSTLQCIKSVAIDNHKITVEETNWALQGRPATDSELDTLLTEMSKDKDEGITSKKLRESVRTWKKKYI